MAGRYETGQLTNGQLVRELEARSAERLGVRHAIAVSSCTAGLMLSIQALCPRRGVVVPSFTFSASAHAVAWNGVPPVFAECDPTTFQLDPDDAGARIGAADAVLATHVFGAPCAVDDLVTLARRQEVPIVFDAAHAFGARHGDRAVGGFGDAEVFSLSPTKVVVAGEGGIVATDRDDVAEAVRIGRDYGNPGDYDTRFCGLNARLSEFHAAMALESLELLEDHLATRRQMAARYVDGLEALDGVRCQAVGDGDLSTYKDFTIDIDAARLGLDRDLVARALAADGVETRRYYWPPIHRQQAYGQVAPAELPVTDAVAARVLSLPMFGSLTPMAVDRVVEVLADIAEHAEAIRAVSRA